MNHIKPLESINKIISLCYVNGVHRKASKNDSIIINDMVIFLLSGTVSVRRGDGITLMSFSGPVVLGLSDFIGGSHDLSLFFHSPATFNVMSRQKVLTACNEHNLWFDVSCILSYVLELVYQKLELSEQKTKYDTIKKYLCIINSLPAEERESLSIYEYIMSRTGMSRSALNKILSGLRRGGYIEMYRGRLVKMNKLPEKF